MTTLCVLALISLGGLGVRMVVTVLFRGVEIERDEDDR